MSIPWCQFTHEDFKTDQSSELSRKSCQELRVVINVSTLRHMVHKVTWGLGCFKCAIRSTRCSRNSWTRCQTSPWIFILYFVPSVSCRHFVCVCFGVIWLLGPWVLVIFMAIPWSFLDLHKVCDFAMLCEAGIDLRLQQSGPETTEERAERLQKDL